MKILFVCSGNKHFGISPIIKSQAKSLERLGLRITYFKIKGKGFFSYLKSIFELNSYLKNNEIDLIHSHYSLSGYVALLSNFKKNIIVSLMGSDLHASFLNKKLALFCSKFFWKVTIVKSQSMLKNIHSKYFKIIPNGVDFRKFRPIDKGKALKFTKWDIKKKHILFAANSKNNVKNFSLALDAFREIDNGDLVLHQLKNIPHSNMPYYLNASDVILLTSFYEGSPNVIKEAMACNRPIVSTDVGDIKKVLSSTKGCFVSGFNSTQIAENLSKALTHNYTDGRDNIRNLDDKLVAIKIANLYFRSLVKKEI